MPLKDIRLSVMTFPQRWDGESLSVNVLALPVGSPLDPLAMGAPAFAGTQLPLSAVLISGLAHLPALDLNAAQATTIPMSPAPDAPPEAEALFNAFAAKYTIASGPKPMLANVSVRKALPRSYMEAFAFEPRGGGNTVVGDGFGCAIKQKDPGKNDPPPQKNVTSWGEIISFALRQPLLARQLGLLYSFTFGVDRALVKDGGWIYFTLDSAANPWAAALAGTPDLIRLYAARLPALSAGRPLMAAVLFPVVSTVANAGVYDEALPEAENYDDGFAKIVHSNQPETVDATAGDASQIRPGADAGLQLGWDDEQVTIWHNRQLATAVARRNGTPLEIDLPLGVLGYRVDVRPGAQGAWESLCLVSGQYTSGAVDEPFTMDLPLEPVAVRSRAPSDVEAWLPRYFAQWRGHSLAVDDPNAYQLTGGEQAAPVASLTPQLPATKLMFGNRYDFRVRLADLTHGGPAADDGAFNPAPAPVSETLFQRFIPPKAARISSAPDPVEGEAIRSLTDVFVWRPLLHYPECAFAGVSAGDVSRLVAQIAAGKANKAVLGVTDPDVDRIRVTVEARTPAHDTSDAAQLDGGFREVYSFEVPFPALPADLVPPAPPQAPDAAEAIHLQIAPVDIANAAKMALPDVAAPGGAQALPVPSSRDVRIRITPLAASANADYFGNDAAKVGLTSDLMTRTAAGAEDNVFVAEIEAEELKAMLLQPVADSTELIERVAQPLQVTGKGLTLAARPGTRVAFGASQGLRHTLAGDHSTITFAAESELLRHWVVGIALEIDRDWTWDGLADAGLLVERQDAPRGAFRAVGNLRVPRTVSDVALAGVNARRRESTKLVFFDAVNPEPAADSFPVSPAVAWRVTPQFRSGNFAGSVKTLEVTLPIASAPRQTPKIVSAGYALSPYAAAEDYSSSERRSRALWIEFESAPEDPQDAFFARVLHYGVDPLLAFTAESASEPEDPKLPVDAEAIRVITPGQSIDTAGLGAMARMTRSAASDRHYLLPLPAGLNEDSPELFGFWTYEFRAGHDADPLTKQPVWSTAQARFGRPLRAVGIQHPAPRLKCQPVRVTAPQSEIVVTAPFATPVLGGQRLLSEQVRPRTELWFLLYAQVARADGGGNVNVLVDRVPGVWDAAGQDWRALRDFFAVSAFTDVEVRRRLDDLALPAGSALSVLAVEVLPGGDPQALTDPLGRDLGKRRILRTSPLTAVENLC